MKKLLLLFCFTVTLLISCNDNEANDDQCISYSPAVIDAVTLIPTVDMIGAVFNVAFYVNNGCGDFGSFEETIDGNTITIKVIAKYEGCVCTDDIPLRESVYTFTSATAGTYTLKFLKTDGTFITETVVID
jgi:hypothetical protein